MANDTIDNNEIMLLKDLHLLFVEDEEMLRDSLVPAFKKLFKSVHVMNNGEDAYYAYQSNEIDIDIIVSDYIMPHMNGLELLENIRKDNSKIPFIFCSAINEQDMFIKAIELDAYSFVKKPVDMKVLLNQIIAATKEQIEIKTQTEKNKLYQSQLKQTIFSKNKDIYTKHKEVVDLKNQLDYVQNSDDLVAKNKMLRINKLELEDELRKLKEDNTKAIAKQDKALMDLEKELTNKHEKEIRENKKRILRQDERIENIEKQLITQKETIEKQDKIILELRDLIVYYGGSTAEDKMNLLLSKYNT